MLVINAIYAHGINGEFALKDGSLPWKNIEELKEDSQRDMKNFKMLTTGSVIIMGYNTFLAIGRKLPDRENIIIDRNSQIKCLEDAINLLEERNENKKIFIIGGAKILHEAFKKNLINGTIYETIFYRSFPEATVFI